MAGSGWDAEWRHHDLSNPALAAVSLYAVEAMASLIHHNADVDGVALAAAVGATVAAWSGHRHFWLQVHLTVATVVSLAWIIYAEHAGPFTATCLTMFAGAAILLGLLYHVFALVDRRDKRKADERMNALIKRKADRGDWCALFATFGVRDVVQIGEPVSTRAGQTLTFRLSPTGKATFGRVLTLSTQLETALDLPPGVVRFRQVQGEGSATFHVDLLTRDVLAEEVPIPDDFSERSINEKFSIGMDEFGENIEILLRELSTMIFAPKGSGKSNMINVLIAMLARCNDVVIWVIDLKGGRVARPWLAPWFDGRTKRPVVDWVATTPDEAHLMLQSAVAAIEHRSVTGEGEKITPSPDQPAIFLIADEGANLTGLRAAGGVKRSELAFDVIGRGRSEAVDTIMAFLRATVSLTGSGDLKSQSQLRIALGAASSADGTSALDSPGMGSQVAAFRHAGSILVQGKDGSRLGKAYRVEYEDIGPIAEACSEWRPGLEEDLEEELGEVYANRWSLDRSGHLLPRDRQKELGILGNGPKPAGATATMTAPRPITTLPTIPPPPKNPKPAFRTVDGRPLPRPTDPASVEAMFAAITEDLADFGKDIERNAPHRGRTRMLGLIAAAGRDGIKPSELTEKLNGEGIDCVRQTVQEWLRDEVGRGRIVNRGNGIYVTKEND